MNFLDHQIIKNKLVTYLNNTTFTGCAVGYSCLDKMDGRKSTFFVGKNGQKNTDIEVDSTTFFDAASLTKPLVTVLSLLSLLKSGKINLKDHLVKLLPEVHIPADKQKITIKQLVSHSSGLPAHRPYYDSFTSEKKRNAKEYIIQRILQEELQEIPGKRYIYSDLDYILLGHIIEKISDTTLSRYWYKKIIDPMGISDKFYCFGETSRKKYSDFAATGTCRWSGKKLKGIVNDDNCRMLGQMAGHAGLFASLEGIVNLCEKITRVILGDDTHPEIDREDILLLSKKRDGEKRVLGFDVPTGGNPSSGKYFSEETIGHLGYTGTSFWIDLKKKVVVVVLTNRVICDEGGSKIRVMRPEIHNCIMEILKK